MSQLIAFWLAFVFISDSIAVNSSGFYWHITDFHYDHTYWTDQLSCNDVVPRPGMYGDYWCDSPWQLVVDSIASIVNIKKDVDFVIWTGDNAAHIKDDNITLDVYVEIIRNITTVFHNYLSGVNVYASLGNHDIYPTSQASYNESRIYREVADLWKNWFSNQADTELLKGGGYYMAKVMPKIRLLALNTVLYFRSNDVTKDLDDPAGQMDWMTNQLQEARNKGEKVIVTAHVPPGLLVPGLVDWFNPRHKTRFVDILLQFSDVIVISHFGHDHRDNFKILQDKNGRNAIAHFSAPSVTPWRHRIVSETGQPHNPGVRLVEYDRDTGRHINYVQYYMNLTDSNNEGKSHWTKLYSFKDDYNVEDLSVTSLRKIFSRLENGEDEELATKYCTYSLVSNHQIKCTAKERAEIYCGGVKHTLTEAENCRNQYLNVATKYVQGVFCIIATVAVVLMMTP